MRFFKIIVSGLLILAMLYFAVNIFQVQNSIAKEGRNIANQELEIEQLKQREAVLKNQIDLLEKIKTNNDLSLIEKYARENGLVKEGEILYKNAHAIQ